nr:hypothetical protein [Tanacetum cinerariifolium]
MDAKLAWLVKKYYYHSQTYIGGSSSQTREIGDGYITAEELHQLNVNEEALKETLEEQAIDEKRQKKKLSKNKLKMMISLSYLGCTRVEPPSYTPNPVRIILDPAGTVQLSSSTCFEPSSTTLNPVRIIPGLAGFVQQAKQLKEKVIILDPGGGVITTNYVISTGDIVTGCLGDINNFLKKEKLEQVVAIVKSCSSNTLGDLNVTMKDLSGTVRRPVHYKVLDVGSYGNDNIV